MVFNIKQLYNNPGARLLARLSRHSTVTLSTGKELKIDKYFRSESTCSYEGSLEGIEEEEFVYVMVLMGI